MELHAGAALVGGRSSKGPQAAVEFGC